MNDDAARADAERVFHLHAAHAVRTGGLSVALRRSRIIGDAGCRRQAGSCLRSRSWFALGISGRSPRSGMVSPSGSAGTSPSAPSGGVPPSMPPMPPGRPPPMPPGHRAAERHIGCVHCRRGHACAKTMHRRQGGAVIVNSRIHAGIRSVHLDSAASHDIIVESKTVRARANAESPPEIWMANGRCLSSISLLIRWRRRPRRLYQDHRCTRLPSCPQGPHSCP